MEVKTRKNFLNLIIPQSSASIKPSQQQQSLPLQQLKESSETLPPLPEHLDELIGQPWTSENSRRVDLWLLYCQMEFETLGGEY
jgi:hypothetical protein